jgi:S-DNA-T family DNA segregation ATPase FtsK/SpoIIIE
LARNNARVKSASGRNARSGTAPKNRGNAANRSATKGSAAKGRAPKRSAPKAGSASVKTAERRTANHPGDSRIRDEIIFLVVLAFSILLFLSNFGVSANFGTMIARFFFGLFGLMEYAFPVLIVFGYIFVLSNRGNPRLTRKMAGAAGLFFFICAFFQLVIMHFDRQTRIVDLYFDSAYDKSGGGLCGGLLVQLFGSLFGQAGAYVCVLIGLIIFAILMTQEPLLRHLRERSENAYENAVENRTKKAEARRKRQERRAAARRLRRARAVPADEPEEYDEDGEEDLGSVEEIEHRRMAGIRASSASRPVRAAGPVIHGDFDGDEPESVLPEEDSPSHRSSVSDGADPDGGLSQAPISVPEFLSGPETAGQQPAGRTLRNAGSKPAGQTLRNAGSKPAEPGAMDSIRKSGQALMSALRAGSKPGKSRAKAGAAMEEPADGAAAMEEISAGAAAKEQPSGAVQKEQPSGAVQNEQPSVAAKAVRFRMKREPDGDRYEFPPLSLMKAPSASAKNESATRDELRDTAEKLQQTLHDFGVEVQVTDVSCGPTVTRYELHPEHGVKVSRILNLQDDIKLNLAAADIRIEAPIPGKAAVGIEVPNKSNSTVMLRELLESGTFRRSKAKIPFAVGKDIAGKPVVADISKMPHLLIAGATGSGKSVCINTLIVSILYRSLPEEVKFIMIDPKMVELSVYNGIPHLYIPVVTDPKKAAGALNWAVSEMIDRYNRFAGLGVRDIDGYNAKISEAPDPEDGSERPKKMPRIVIIVDELADLMMVAQHEVEDAIVRLSQLARAAGIHLVIATQRPSVNVITGLIKANMPSRIALAVTSGVDSRTILDMNGAEKLLGKGDMLFYPQGYQKPARVQGAFVSDEEITSIVSFLTEKNEKSEYDAEAEKKITESASVTAGSPEQEEEKSKNDVYFERAGRLIIEKDKASIGMLQRAFKIGFNRAARIMDQLCDAGIVGEEEGTKPRHILMTMEEFQNYIETHET